jgi:hypothetical protein
LCCETPVVICEDAKTSACLGEPPKDSCTWGILVFFCVWYYSCVQFVSCRRFTLTLSQNCFLFSTSFC